MGELDGMKIPQHIAIVLDGNGRWAKKRGLPRKAGHVEGCKTLEKIIEDVARMGVGYLTVYAFSTENWKRDEDEVDALMQLFRFYAKRMMKVAAENNVRVKMIGEKNRFAKDIIKAIDNMVESTKDNTGLTFVIAVNYGSRDEITRSVKNILADYQAGRFELDAVDEEFISGYLDTRQIPDPDLLIRTSGEQRLSNFLLWQSAYTEFYFPEVLWPDFDHEELVKAVLQYNKRERRFGGV